MTVIQKCWTGIWEMNKYESTREGMRSLELLMTLTASYQEIKQKNSERTAENHTKIGSCCLCHSCWNIWKDSQYKDSNGENFAVFGR
jgi:hypothetical protein